MKLKNTFILLTTLFISSFLTSCDDDYVNSVKDGEYFLRGNSVRLYYIDDEGNDLIDPEDITTFPIVYDNDEEYPTDVVIPDDYDPEHGYYKGNWCKITYDESEKLHYMSTTVPGHERKSNYTFYIGYKDEFDCMDMKYKYTSKDVIGRGYYAKIVSWKFNGQKIYSDDDEDVKVFVTKSNGETTLSVKKK